MSQQRSPQGDPMVGEVRFRVPLPILIPAATLLMIAGVTVAMSRVLLSIPAEAATVVALATAANILIAAGVLAHRKRMESTSLIEMGVIVLYPLVIGVVIALLGIGGTGGSHDTTSDQPAQASGPVQAGGTMSAEGLQFSTDAIELPAGKESEITFENNDVTTHNIRIYETAEDADSLVDDATLFQGEDVPQEKSMVYSLPAFDKGEYPFLCRIHPAMRGVVTVK